MTWQEAERGGGAQMTVLGDPIAHSLSPIMQQAAMRAAGIDGHYKALLVPSGEFVKCIERLRSIGYVGANVTLPHKGAARELFPCNDCQHGTANTISFVRAECTDTDTPAFASLIQGVPADTALILGAGDTASLVGKELLARGWSLRIWNRTAERGRKLAAHLNASSVDQPNSMGCSLLVNCTPIGLGMDTPLVPGEWLEPDTTVIDLAYQTGPTPLLSLAKSRGCPVIDGRLMLVEQGALAFEWWFGIAAPRDVMRKAVGL